MTYLGADIEQPRLFSVFGYASVIHEGVVPSSTGGGEATVPVIEARHDEIN